MPSRNRLPDRMPRASRTRGTGRFVVERIFDEFGPISLGLEYGAIGLTIGLLVWLAMGLAWALVVGIGTAIGLWRVRHT